ncbi:MAG TPA: ankyrin repeat domain-containing protein, partial [Chitinispirillaceae bacterium]|nr:ankyrin repeat domain-containing protein [Chitinispirillaceae bacterium]
MLKLNSNHILIVILLTFTFCANKGETKSTRSSVDSSKTTLVQPDTTPVNEPSVTATMEIDGYTASELGRAVYANNLQLVKVLVEKGASTTNCLATEMYEFDLLFAAIEFAKIDIVKYVLDNKLYTSINKVYTEESETPLTLACALENLHDAASIAELLIKNGADVNGAGSVGGDYTYYPLINAIKKGNVQLTKLLIDNGAKPGIEDNQ